MKIPKGIDKNDQGMIGVKLKLAGRARELSVVMPFDLYRELDDAALRAHLCKAASLAGERNPVLVDYKPYQRLDALV